MAGHHLIDAYVEELARRLPADTVDELADGLHETWRRHLDAGLSAPVAARAAIAEFGTPAQVTDAFVAYSPGRRTARTLLATGPVVGVCWGSSLVAAEAWTWPVPAAVGVVFVVTLLSVVGCLLAAATSRHSYRRARLGGVGGAGLVVLDMVMLAAVLVVAVFVWPMVFAVAASVARVAMVARRFPWLRPG